MGCFSPVSSYCPGVENPAGDGLFRQSKSLQLHDQKCGHATVQQAMLGQTKVGRVRSTGHDVSVVVEDQITVLVPLSGTVTCEFHNETFKASANEALVLSPNSRQTRVASENRKFEAIPLMFPVSDVQLLTEELAGSALTRKHLSNFGLTLSLDATFEGRQFLQMVRVLVDELGHDARPLTNNSAQSWSQLLTEKLVILLDTNSLIELPNTQRQGAAHRHVLRAEDYIYEHFADIATVADIAKECGISVRLLEMAFKAARSQTPMACLSAVRLDKARRVLAAKNGVESVTQAAMDCGFNHLGRFSVAYKRQFGETPSETLRKR